MATSTDDNRAVDVAALRAEVYGLSAACRGLGPRARRLVGPVGLARR